MYPAILCKRRPDRAGVDVARPAMPVHVVHPRRACEGIDEMTRLLCVLAQSCHAARISLPLYGHEDLVEDLPLQSQHDMLDGALSRNIARETLTCLDRVAGVGPNTVVNPDQPSIHVGTFLNRPKCNIFIGSPIWSPLIVNMSFARSRTEVPLIRVRAPCSRQPACC